MLPVLYTFRTAIRSLVIPQGFCITLLGYRYANTYRALNRGAHVADDGDLRLLTADARALVARIHAALS